MNIACFFQQQKLNITGHAKGHIISFISLFCLKLDNCNIFSWMSGWLWGLFNSDYKVKLSWISVHWLARLSIKSQSRLVLVSTSFKFVGLDISLKCGSQQVLFSTYFVFLDMYYQYYLTSIWSNLAGTNHCFPFKAFH